ncbi:Glutathione peroxidase [Bacillus cereus AH1272]|nr:Glutathione peroxidase [Bacillus cereus AH1272]EEL93975.1 Glutathione peroxidase [Bacillus cereus AH1273]
MMEQAPVLLVMKAVKWKFTKFLIGRNGESDRKFRTTDKAS